METPATSEHQQTESARYGANAAIPGDDMFYAKIDSHTLEDLTELKISRFLDMIGSNYPENLHKLIMAKVEKPLIKQVLKRKGGNQVQTANILGINRNTLRKKMKEYDLM